MIRMDKKDSQKHAHAAPVWQLLLKSGGNATQGCLVLFLLLLLWRFLCKEYEKAFHSKEMDESNSEVGI